MLNPERKSTQPQPLVAVVAPGANGHPLLSTVAELQSYGTDDERKTKAWQHLCLGNFSETLALLREIRHDGPFDRKAGKLELAVSLALGHDDAALTLCRMLSISSPVPQEVVTFSRLSQVLSAPDAERGERLFREFPEGLGNHFGLWAASLFLSAQQYAASEQTLNRILRWLPDSQPAASLLLKTYALKWDATEAERPLGTALNPNPAWDAGAVMRQAKVTFRASEPQSASEVAYALMEVQRRLTLHPPDAVRLFQSTIGQCSPALAAPFHDLFRAASVSPPTQLSRNSIVEPPAPARVYTPPAKKVAKPKSPPPNKEDLELAPSTIKQLAQARKGGRLNLLAERYPNRGAPHWGLARLSIYRDNLTDAGTNILRALKLEPTLRPALLDGARLAVAAGRFGMAHALLCEYRRTTDDPADAEPLAAVVQFAQRSEPVSPELREDIACELRYIGDEYSPRLAVKVWDAIRGREDADVGTISVMRRLFVECNLPLRQFEMRELRRAMFETEKPTSTDWSKPRKWQIIQRRALSRYLEIDSRKTASEEEPWALHLAYQYAVELALAGGHSPKFWGLIRKLDERCGITPAT